MASEISSTDENLEKDYENSSTNEDSEKGSQNSLSKVLNKHSEISSLEEDIVKDAENNLSEEQAVDKQQNLLPTSEDYDVQFPPILGGIVLIWPPVPVWPVICSRYIQSIPVTCTEIKSSEEGPAKDYENSSSSEDFDKNSEISLFEKDHYKNLENSSFEEQTFNLKQNFLPSSEDYDDRFPPIPNGTVKIWPKVSVWPDRDLQSLYVKHGGNSPADVGSTRLSPEAPPTGDKISSCEISPPNHVDQNPSPNLSLDDDVSPKTDKAEENTAKVSGRSPLLYILRVLFFIICVALFFFQLL